MLNGCKRLHIFSQMLLFLQAVQDEYDAEPVLSGSLEDREDKSTTAN